MELGETVPTSPAVALAVTLRADGPAIICMKPVASALCTVTLNAGTVAEERVTPEMLSGKLNVTVSEAVPPNPLFRAYTQGVRPSAAVQTEEAIGAVPVPNGLADVTLVPSMMLM